MFQKSVVVPKSHPLGKIIDILVFEGGAVKFHLKPSDKDKLRGLRFSYSAMFPSDLLTCRCAASDFVEYLFTHVCSSPLR